VLRSSLLRIGLAGRAASPGPSPETEEYFRVVVEPFHLKVFLRHLSATGRGPGSDRPPVVFIHGATLPSGLSAAFRLDGVSWMDDLAARGFDVWALDFLGYGGSDRYAEMSRPASPAAPQGAPLGRATDAARQIAAAVDFIAARRRGSRVQLVGHSWGTIPAGVYATQAPERVERLVLFGPVTLRHGPRDATTIPPYRLITSEEQVARFTGYVPRGEAPVFDPRHVAVFAPAYLDTDPTSRSRSPASVRAPLGPDADAAAAWSGDLAYDPAKILAPVLVVRGEWDVVTTDGDARWLFDALTAAPVKRDVKINRATHVMQLEAQRGQLYAEVAAFLASDLPAAPLGGATSAGRVIP
jgi:pimeloyl-ACP methyl ester carboxylesterase